MIGPHDQGRDVDAPSSETPEPLRTDERERLERPAWSENWEGHDGLAPDDMESASTDDDPPPLFLSKPLGSNTTPRLPQGNGASRRRPFVVIVGAGMAFLAVGAAAADCA